MYVWTGDRFERHAFHAVLSNLHKRPEPIRLWSRFVFVLEGRFRLFALILSVSPQNLCGFHAIYQQCRSSFNEIDKGSPIIRVFNL